MAGSSWRTLMLTSRLPHDDELRRAQSSQTHRRDSKTTNGHLGCTTHISSDIYPNPANLWRVVYGRAVDFVFFSQCHSRTAARNTRQTPRMQPQNQVSLHVYKHTARWSSQSRPELMFSSRRTSPRSIYWTPSTWKYQVCYYCKICRCWVYGCPCCITGWLPHLSHLTKPQSRRISS